MTGDLNIVKDRQVRKLLIKGPTYREQNNINWKKNEELCIEAVRKYKTKWARTENVDACVLTNWEQEVVGYIKEKIRYLQRKHVRRRKKQVLLDTKHREYLEDFHKQYVLVPADKAANNVIVVCKKHYLDVVLSELQVNNHSNGHTYSEVTIDCHSIINKHLGYLEYFNST